ncbi:MAG: HAD family phosphatase [Rhodobacterales bacterium]|nr:HAD family phosphatase [Rhodobacterales bacterium]NCT12375.1 HAD family phosphatase [Rhodobacterales bacterium]
MRREAVVFDIGNVLVQWQPDAFYDRLIGPERRRALMAEVDLHGMNEGMDRGAPWLPSVRALAGAHPGWADEIMCWHGRWIEMLSPAIDHSVRLLRALRARGVPVFALTNFGVETLEQARARYPFLCEFDRAYVSGALRLMKPEPAIYAAVEADCRIAPGALLFADDRPENIAAAAARGWGVHLFEGPQGWADRLVAEGLLDAAEAG